MWRWLHAVPPARWLRECWRPASAPGAEPGAVGGSGRHLGVERERSWRRFLQRARQRWNAASIGGTVPEGELREEKARERDGGDGGLGERVPLGPPMAVPLSSDGRRTTGDDSVGSGRVVLSRDRGFTTVTVSHIGRGAYSGHFKV
jgi:hypothetical protein